MPQHKDPFQALTESILGVTLTTAQKKASRSDERRREFVDMIELLESVLIRDEQMSTLLRVDMSTYYKPFYELIGRLINYHFGEIVGDLIMFYVQDRFDEEGNIIPIPRQGTNDVIILETPDDLWMVISELTNEPTKQKTRSRKPTKNPGVITEDPLDDEPE